MLADIKTIHEILIDFTQWPIWSPWLIQEPECEITFAEDKQSYAWDGKRVGAGNMQIDTVSESHIDYDLLFLKPWKSKAKIHFFLETKESGTNVTWRMDSSIPLFLFWIKKSIETFVGMDYERGLAMLKDYIETGRVPSQIEFIGNTNYQGHQFIALKNATSIRNIGQTMEADSKALAEYMQEYETLISGKMFSMYHVFDPMKDKVQYTLGIPVSSLPESVDSKFFLGSIPDISVYKLTHVGPYSHLANAWATIYSMERAKEIKCDKALHPFEIYIDTPGEVPENQLRTEIYFPVK